MKCNRKFSHLSASLAGRTAHAQRIHYNIDGTAPGLYKYPKISSNISVLINVLINTLVNTCKNEQLEFNVANVLNNLTCLDELYKVIKERPFL